MKLVVSVVQMKVEKGRPQENLEKAGKFISSAASMGAGLVCFPEMWTTGFVWGDIFRMAEAQKPVISRISDMARRNRLWISGSVLELDDDGRPSNAHILFRPDGTRAGTYRKTHLFKMLEEDKYLAPGKELVTVDTPWGIAGLSVCYDIRFPELFRSYALKGAKLILSPMAFPQARIGHWKVLVRARAIEDQLYMIGANRVGVEDMGSNGNVNYGGASSLIGPLGEAMIEGSEEKEEMLTAEIDMERVDEARGRIGVLKDRRPEIYNI